MQVARQISAPKSGNRNTIGQRLTLGVSAVLSLLGSGCASSDHRLSTPPIAVGDTIEISVGPCFGFCPVYSAKIRPDGSVLFAGERHTEVIGERTRSAGPAVYRTFSDALSPFKPATGTEAQIECDAAISDTSRYTIVWTAPDGRRTTATHQRGCSGGPGKALDAVLTTMPERLGISRWAKQITRAGASRG